MKVRVWGACLLLVVPGIARAVWEQKYSQCGDDQGMATSVHSPDGQHVFACGVNLNVSNPFTDPTHRILVSDDGGEGWRDITGQAQGLTGFMISPLQVFFADAQHGWLNLGSKVARTTDGGLSWAEVETSPAVVRLHFFDTQAGIAVGESGSIWMTSNGGVSFEVVTNPSNVDLGEIAFVDRQHGFVAGNNFHEENGQNVADEGQVLATSDGGQTWQVVWTTSGEFLGRLFFRDTQAGTMAAGNNAAEIYFLMTVNGGAAWTRRDVPTTVSGVPGEVKSLVAVHFHDTQQGRALGFFDTGISLSQGGNIYMIADYQTQNGGGSWSLHVNSPGEFPNFTPEGGMLDAMFYSDRLAWAVGTGLRIYKDAPPCQSSADCFEGFLCEEGACRPNTSGPCLDDADCYGDFVCRDGTCGDSPPGPCESDADCSGGLVCQHGHCVEPGGCDEETHAGCPFGQICVFGTCIQDRTCVDDGDCQVSQRCYESRCYPRDLPEFRCFEDADCATSEHCVDTWCERFAEDGGPDPDGGSTDGGSTDAGGGDGSAAADRDDPGTDGGTGGDGDGGGGCGCHGWAAPAGGGLPPTAALLLLVAAWRRRR